MTEIGEEISTKIVGVTFDDRQAMVRNLVEGETLELVREPKHPKDSNAVAVMKGEDHLGYIGRETALDLAREMDDGGLFNVVVSSIVGGGYEPSGTRRSYGVNIRIKRLNAGRRFWSRRSG